MYNDNSKCVGETAVKELQVPAGVSMIISQIERVENKLANLEDRLKSVIRNEPVVQKTQGNLNQKCLVPHALDLAKCAERIENIADAIEDMNRRIEV